MKLSRFLVGIIAIGAIIGMVLTGCESTDWAAVSESLDTANNEFTNAYSSNSEEGLTYTIYNKSSVPVTVQDSTGAITIAPNGRGSARFNKNASIYDVVYDADAPVEVDQSGTTFTFTDR
ncbi:MAG: hypothetical protein LBO67_00585 [Spirochaetaceae bacterium]|jgi:hypothetical protein|nr:hypothetical protein [Spirochaetaceae bacterium]